MNKIGLKSIYGETKIKIIEDIKSGKIFIYPTDTVYGLGCNAYNEESVKKIKKIKGRDSNKPLSVIAPSLSWILENLETNEEYLKKYLPGPYTLILKKKDNGFMKECSPTEALGIRIPANDFTKIIEEANVPFITTSVNLSGEPTPPSIDNIPKEIQNQVDYMIDAGKLEGKPSTIISNGQSVKR